MGGRDTTKSKKNLPLSANRRKRIPPHVYAARRHRLQKLTPDSFAHPSSSTMEAESTCPDTSCSVEGFVPKFEITDTVELSCRQTTGEGSEVMDDSITLLKQEMDDEVQVSECEYSGSHVSFVKEELKDEEVSNHEEAVPECEASSSKVVFFREEFQDEDLFEYDIFNSLNEADQPDVDPLQVSVSKTDPANGKLMNELKQKAAVKQVWRTCIIKILEVNVLKVVPLDELKQAFNPDLVIFKQNDINYHALVVHKGEKSLMEKQLQELIIYENLVKKYFNFSHRSVSTETEHNERIDIGVQCTDDVVVKDQQDANITEEHPMPVDESFEHLNLAELEVDMISEPPVEGLYQVGPDDSLVLVQLPLKKGHYGEQNITSLDADFDTSNKDICMQEEGQSSGVMANIHRSSDASVSSIEEECEEKKEEEVPEGNQDVHVGGVEKYEGSEEEEEFMEIAEESRPKSNQYLQIGGDEKYEGSEEEEESIEISSVAKYPSGKRRRTKVHCCKFCQQLIVSIGRHIVTVHKEELEVAHILSLNKETRKIVLEQIEREGDYNHNKEVLATGKGELILVRRPTENEISSHTYKDYGPCTGCLGFMLKSHLWHHIKYGCKASLKATETPFSVRLGSEALLAAGLRETYSQDFEIHCIGKLVKDDIGKACIKEETILRYGDFLFQKNLTVDPNHRGNNVRSTMRVLASLHIHLQEKLPAISFTDIFEPKNFDVTVSTVRGMCVYNEISKKSDLVSLSKAVRLGIELIKVGEFIQGEHIMRGNSTKEQLIKNFIFLVKTQWNTRIFCTARSTLEQRKFNKTDILPLTSDLLRLNKHVHNVCLQSKSKLEEEINPTAYRNLSEALLTRIILFNKRRPVESAKMEIQEYQERAMWTNETSDELKTTLSRTELDLAENLTLVYTKGKRITKVPVLLTSEMTEQLKLLIRVRNMHGIEKHNPYIFARPYPAESPLRGHDCLRKMCEDAGLQAIERVTGTKLRKYVATVSQVFNLSENETDWLAKHMGHDIRVHHQFYRLHESALELTKVSRILLAIDKGKANQFAGKPLSEINIDDMSDLEEEESTPNFQASNVEDHLEFEQGHLDQNRVHQNEVSQKLNTIDPQIDNNEDYVPVPEEDSDNVVETKKRKKLRSGRSVIKQPWSSAEKTAVLAFFQETIAKQIGVKKDQAEKCIQMYSVLKGRTWLNIRDFIRNHIRKFK